MIPNQRPYEVVAGPVTVWIGPVGAEFPAIDEAPDVRGGAFSPLAFSIAFALSGLGWTLLGTSGALNYTDDGLTVEHRQTVTFRRSLLRPGPRRAVRVDETVWIRVTVVDLTLEQYRLAVNSNTVVAIVGGKRIGTYRGVAMTRSALLVRGSSPYMADGALQYEIPVAVQVGIPQPIFRRDQPAGLSLEWQALIDLTAESADEQHGRLVAQVA